MHAEDKRTLWWAVIRSPVVGAVTGCVLGILYESAVVTVADMWGTMQGYSPAWEYLPQMAGWGGIFGTLLGAVLGSVTGVSLMVTLRCREHLLDDFPKLYRVVGGVSFFLNAVPCWLGAFWFLGGHLWNADIDPLNPLFSNFTLVSTFVLVAGFGAFYVSRRCVKWLAPVGATAAHHPK